ncbi:MAG: exodeoxyribonuclease III [Bacilli bacterium]
MKLVSWNVAGFRACLKKGFKEFFENVDADIFCLQEVKATKDQYDFSPEGYYEYLFPAEKKGYSGTLIYTKIKPINFFYGIDNPLYDSEGRTITLEYENFYLVNVYVPNVKRDLSRLQDRMNFEEEFKNYLVSLSKTKPVIICGDFNVAHTEIDIKNAKQNIGNAGFTYEEREKFTNLLNAGFIDTFRHFHENEENHYTWWSYLYDARSKNVGWRIDYFLVSDYFIESVKNTTIYKDIYGSDHCPIGIEID